DQLAERVRAAEETGAPLDRDAQRGLAGELIARQLDGVARERLEAGEDPLPLPEEDVLRDAVFHALFGLGPLERYLADPTVENIVANGCDQVWLLHADGSKRRADPTAASDEELVALLQAAAARMGRS